MTLTDEAESLLLHQFQRAPKLKALMRALIEPFRAVDEELHRLHHGRYIDHAEGNVLDVIGSIVGQSRNNMTDEDYRAWIKVAICLNTGHGTPENVLSILHILFGKKPPIEMHEYAPNDVMFTFFEYPKFPPKTLLAIVRSAVPVTTKCQFVRADERRSHKNSLEISSTRLPVFRLDVTAFSACSFADFFEGDFS